MSAQKAIQWLEDDFNKEWEKEGYTSTSFFSVFNSDITVMNYDGFRPQPYGNWMFSLKEDSDETSAGLPLFPILSIPESVAEYEKNTGEKYYAQIDDTSPVSA